MKVITSPLNISKHHNRQKLIFLAGSIENGKAEDWQATVVKYFLNDEMYTLLNPRRDAWDTSWEQKISNPVFKEQVTWELDGLERADKIIMYFSPDTKAPISLLEFGLHAQSGKVLVCCPEGFWRKGNVDIVCEKYNVPLYTDLMELLRENF